MKSFIWIYVGVWARCYGVGRARRAKCSFTVARARCLSGREPGPLTGGRHVIHLSCSDEIPIDLGLAHYCDAGATHNDEKQPYGVSLGSEFLFKIDRDEVVTWREKKKKVDFC